MDSGLDSLLAVEFRQRLVNELKIKLPSTFLFDHPTISAINSHLNDMQAPARNQPAPAAGTPNGVTRC